MSRTADYLAPYRRAAAKHQAGFASLLWASPATQLARFDAIARLYDFDDARILDAGCGRADLLDFFLDRGIHPSHYTGLEAVPELAAAARTKLREHDLVIEADFVREPSRLLVGAEAIIFSGSLNTLDDAAFHNTLRIAFDAASRAVILNFLASPSLACAPWLTWHQPQSVVSFAGRLASHVQTLADYLDGDCTIALWK